MILTYLKVIDHHRFVLWSTNFHVIVGIYGVKWDYLKHRGNLELIALSTPGL